MVKVVDTREREAEILKRVVESYIEESRPISSSYICEKYRLNCSSATVRNVMLALEKDGFLSHIHTSSGRVPTQEGFRRYAEQVKEEEVAGNYPVSLDYNSLPRLDMNEIMNYMLDMLSQYSGYASLVAISGSDEKMLFKGMRFILEQPEFEDVSVLKNIFYLFEVKMSALENLLFNCAGDHTHILIGDDIGFEEISKCSLVVSGLRQRQIAFALALLGPMRMHYAKAVACLYSVRQQLKQAMEELL